MQKRVTFGVVSTLAALTTGGGFRGRVLGIRAGDGSGTTMRNGLIGAIVAVVVIPQVASRADEPRAQSPTAEQVAQEKQIKKFIAELGDDSRRVRVNAEQGLLKIGPTVLPFLPARELLPNLSAREAVKRIRVQLEYRKATESVLPSRVTLSGEYRLKTVLAAITRQTGNRIDASKLSQAVLEEKIRCDFRKRVFWSVVEELARRVPVAFDVDSNRLVLQPVAGRVESKRVYSDRSTAFRVVVVSATTKPLFGDASKRLLRVAWKIVPEPRLRPLFLKYAAAGVTADSGRLSFPPFDPDARYELPLGGAGRGLSMHADFLIPVKNPPESVRVRGALRLHTAAGNEPIEFRRLDQAAGTSIRRGGVTVTLQKAVFAKQPRNGKRHVKIRVAVGYDVGGPAFESHRTWMFHNRVYMSGKPGKQIPQEGVFKTTLQDDGAVGVEYNFNVPDGSSSEYRFVYVAPTLLIDVPVRFGVANIPVSKNLKERKQK